MLGDRCRANMAHIRQSRPDSCLGCQVKFLKTFFARKRGVSTPRPWGPLSRRDDLMGRIVSGCPVSEDRYRANMANIRQSRPDSSLGFQVKSFQILQGVRSLFAWQRLSQSTLGSCTRLITIQSSPGSLVPTWWQLNRCRARREHL